MQQTRAGRWLACVSGFGLLFVLLLWLPRLRGATIPPASRPQASRPAGGEQRPAKDKDKDKDKDAPIIHIPVPLDVQLFHLHYSAALAPDQNGPHEFALIGSLESPAWNGLRILGSHRLVTPAGRILRTYPAPLIFRVTASLHPPALFEVDTSDLDAPRRVDDLLDHLRFVIRINHNLHQWQYPVRRPRNIGMPMDDAYPERTYEIVFRPARPLAFTYVICLDVYGPDGTRLAKFYLPEF